MKLFSKLSAHYEVTYRFAVAKKQIVVRTVPNNEEQAIVRGFLDSLKQCTDSRDLVRGRSIHVQAIECGFHSNIYLATSLIAMYAKCGSLVDARKVFDSMPRRTAATWNALILGCVENGQSEAALQLYNRMWSTISCQPNSRTFVAALKACSSLANLEEATKLVKTKNSKWGASFHLEAANTMEEATQALKKASLEKGMAIHSEAVKAGWCDDVFVGNTLVDMYAKCGSMVDSRSAFDRMPFHTVVSWNILLLGYVANGDNTLVLELFSCMRHYEDFEVDERAYVAALMACASMADSEEFSQVDDKLVKIKSLSKGIAVHSEAKKTGVSNDVFVGSSLIDMYSKCGSMVDAYKVFQEIVRRDVVVWTALIIGYVENGESERGLELLREMQSKGCSPNSKTYVAAFMACGNSMDLGTGKSLHAEILGRGLEEENAASLVNFYGKFGALDDCERVFHSSPTCAKETLAWSSLIAGYSQQGDATQVLELFNEMRELRLRVTSVTIVSVLTACSHTGLIAEGKRLFDSMEPEFGIVPRLDHFSCLIDMFARANRLEEAVIIAEKMPFKADAVTWTSVLAASCKWKNLVAGTKAFEALMRLDNKDAAAYMAMANIYKSITLRGSENEDIVREATKNF